MSREKILSKIKNVPVDMKFQSVDVVDFIKDEVGADLVSEYIARATENKAFVQTSSDLITDINAIITKENVKNLIYPTNLPIDLDAVLVESKFAFDKPIEEFKSELFSYDVSIIQARKAVSSHGVFCVTSSPAQPRLLSLTPKVCIVLLKRENIVKSLSVALNEIKAEDGRLPTNVLFICGPSRTSDIELVPVLGVHGSQIVYVLVY
ncbi:lactate utilization protein C [Campylobacter sp. 9BO]|uniref:LutC/YkgG family protein n=1 Tax=Campylobacter sp. 9BO TaxID=3424759 RepID=UPI003D3309C5